MAFDDTCVYASGNVPEKNMLCVRADGEGDVTDTHVLWQTREANTYVPSPLVSGDLLFLVLDGGIAFCREAQTGQVLWKERLGGDFSASPVLAGDYIYATSESGVTHVFRASRQFERIAENDLGEGTLATPAICVGQIFLRTATHLFCIEGR
jgi:outer membrane protein assembly factor BamB